MKSLSGWNSLFLQKVMIKYVLFVNNFLIIHSDQTDKLTISVSLFVYHLFVCLQPKDHFKCSVKIYQIPIFWSESQPQRQK